MTATALTGRVDLAATAHQIGVDVAACAADAVDRDARFPHEAITALRGQGMLAALVPPECGGMGCTISEVAAACEALGQYCASTAMVFAMHQIQVACIVRHAHNAPFFRDYLRELAERQPLVASATSEVGVGGDLRTSICAVERDGTAFTLHKNAATVSYGERADDILATARRAPDAAAGEQVLVLLRRPDTSLERTTAWDTLGLRGTCSPGFQLSAHGRCEQILPTPFAEIASRTMLPVSHVMWSAVWLGLATGAVSLARAFVRRAARRQPGRAPATSGRLAEVVRLLQGMRSEVHDATDAYERVMDDAVATSGIGFVVRMNNLKVTSSQLVVEIVGQALMICGIEGYRVDSPFGLGRQLRDAYGAPVMVSNDRIRVTNATLLLVQKDD